MKAQDFIQESSGYSLKGSYTPDLVFSKLWLARELKKILEELGIEQIPVAYILGSWYGNLAVVLRKQNFPVEKIIDVEQNAEWLKLGQRIQQQMGIAGVQSMQADANRIDYRQLQTPGLVINTSTNDMVNRGWFDHIPAGTIVVLQGRNAVSKEAAYTYESVDDLLKQYPLDTILYSGSLLLKDPETDYQRIMVIGIKRR